VSFLHSIRKRAFFISAALLATACIALPAMAEDSASSGQAATGEVFRWLNFILVFGGAAFLIAKNGGAFFRGNAQAIAADIHEASAAKAEAERELREVQSKLAGVNGEIAQLRQQAERDAVAEEERLRASGRAEIDKINHAAQAELAATERVAEQELRALAASIAVERAAALLQAEMTPEARTRMFHAFLHEIGRGQALRSTN
jgi:F-type H+-transporting ATPase subunit b